MQKIFVYENEWLRGGFSHGILKYTVEAQYTVQFFLKIELEKLETQDANPL